MGEGCDGVMVGRILSAQPTRGADCRLRHPEPEGIEQIVGFAPPAALVAFYQDSPLAERSGVYLVDRSKQPVAAWTIGRFSPLTPADVRERRKIAGLNDGLDYRRWAEGNTALARSGSDAGER